MNLILPDIILLSLGFLILIADLFFKKEDGRSPAFLIAWLGFTLISFLLLCQEPIKETIILGSYHITGLGFCFKFLFSLASLFTILLARSYFIKDGNSRGPLKHEGEFYALITFCTFGMFTVASANGLITLFIGVELATIPLYILSSYQKDDKLSSEAGAKYIIMGAVSTAISLFGYSLIYGAVGDVSFEAISNFILQMPQLPDRTFILWVGSLFVIVSLGFKMGLAPFHMWVPDVYHGAPTPVTAFLSVGSKSVAVAFFLILFFGPLEGLLPGLKTIFIVLACLTMVVGNLGALKQRNLRRFMAYSSIAQAGYIFVGFLGTGPTAQTAIIYYLLVFIFTNMCTFFIISVIGQKRSEDFTSLQGLGKQNPGLSAILMLCMFSLAGIPPLAGFTGKFFLFAAAAEKGYYFLVFFAALNSTLSLYYYLLIIKESYIVKTERKLPTIEINIRQRICITVLTCGVLILGLIPSVIDKISNLIEIN